MEMSDSKKCLSSLEALVLPIQLLICSFLGRREIADFSIAICKFITSGRIIYKDDDPGIGSKHVSFLRILDSRKVRLLKTSLSVTRVYLDMSNEWVDTRVLDSLFPNLECLEIFGRKGLTWVPKSVRQLRLSNFDYVDLQKSPIPRWLFVAMRFEDSVIWLPNRTDNITDLKITQGTLDTESKTLYVPGLSSAHIKNCKVEINAPNLFRLMADSLQHYTKCLRLRDLRLNLGNLSNWESSILILRDCFPELETLVLCVPMDAESIEKPKTLAPFIPKSVTTLHYTGPMPYVLNLENLKSLEIADYVSSGKETVDLKLPSSLENLTIEFADNVTVLNLHAGQKLGSLETNGIFSAETRLPKSMSDLEVNVWSFEQNPEIMCGLDLDSLKINGIPKELSESVYSGPVVKFPRSVKRASIAYYDKYLTDFDFRGSKIDRLEIGEGHYHCALPDLKGATVRELKLGGITKFLLEMRLRDYFPAGLEYLDLDLQSQIMPPYKGLFPDDLRHLILRNCCLINSECLPKFLKRLEFHNPSTRENDRIKALKTDAEVSVNPSGSYSKPRSYAADRPL